MVERTGYLDGEPCWADVTAPDMAVAQRFYGAVLGWTFSDTGAESGHYTLCLRDGRTVAAITPPPPGSDGTPPAWTLYLASADAHASATAIDAAGGKVVMGPMTIPGSGTMLHAVDPAGAAFGIWQGGEHIGCDVYNEVGTLCWAEVNTRDPGATDRFYRNVFGYQQEQLGDGETFDYTFWTVPGGDRPVAGRLTMPAALDGVTPSWMVHYAVDDADAATIRVNETGGTVEQSPFDSPYGRIAVVSDPHGALLTLIDASRPTDPGAGPA